LVSPFIFKELAEKGLVLLNNKTLSTRLGQAGRKRVVDAFNLKDHVLKIECIFDNL
jgi:hypothetical protein